MNGSKKLEPEQPFAQSFSVHPKFFIFLRGAAELLVSKSALATMALCPLTRRSASWPFTVLRARRCPETLASWFPLDRICSATWWAAP